MSQLELTTAEQELLKYACKAAGREPDQIDEHGAWLRGEPDPIVGAWSNFNPLTNNGHAFVLVTQLRLMVELSEDGHEARADAYTGHHWTELCDGDADAALRRAITACAALMGGYKP